MGPDYKAIEQEAIDSLDTLAAVPGFQGMVGRLIGWIDTLFTGMAVVALVAIAGTVLLQVVSRLFLPFSPAWTEELSRYLFLYMVALAAGVVLRKNRNVNVELFHHCLGIRARAAYQALICLLIAGFAWVVLPHAWQYAQNGAWQTSPTLRIPMLYIFFSTVVTFGLLLFYGVIGFLEGGIAMFRPLDRNEQETP
ncbi:TRAP transporter small permease [Billgrantia endophytica]|uniref:TRAP transporter small permease protein n=1 Tax=Billgrantia endophytica TaxID=2033802 RepID=A0A2N7TWD9_9GAMM|nr:TRAP transporter small permease [Halomonas endophytica]PMR72496.1 TRAP transporter small permease [Halomonas endophytica]